MNGSEGLQRRLATVHALLSNIPDPVILVDAHTVVREANDAGHNLLPGLKVAQPLSYVLRAPDILDGIDAVLTTGQSLRVEYHQRVPIERTFDVQIGVLGISAAARGDERSVMLFFRDLTAARRLEQMRVDFVANVSHELRTPLSSLVGFIETLQGTARDDVAARDRFLEIMRTQAWRMTRLIDDLLSLSRIELRAHIPPTSPVDLRLLTAEIVETLGSMAREGGIEIALGIGDEPLLVAGDRDELLRVVENLVENAVKYGASGGRVEVSLARSGGPALPKSIELVVRDYGPGIAPEHLPRLTERFYRVDVAESRDKGGTGLGLAIVKHIVNRHRGRLFIDSRPGHGAEFRVVLPTHQGPGNQT